MLFSIAIILIISGAFFSVSKFKNNDQTIWYIASFIIGISSIALSKDYIFQGGRINNTIILVLILALGVSFALGEIFKNKKAERFLAIPFLIGFPTFLTKDFAEHSYLGQQIESELILALTVMMGLLLPFILHYIIKYTKSIFQENENEQLLSGALVFIFIGGFAAISNFLLGPIAMLTTGTFLLATTFMIRDRYAVSTNVLLNAGNALMLISATNIIVHRTGFDGIDLTAGQVLEGVFLAGFLVLIYELFIKTAQKKNSKMFLIFAIVKPIAAVALFGLLYTQLERLGGLLTLSAALITLGVLGLFYSSLKNNTNISGVKLLTLGTTIMLMPIITPVQQSSEIDLDALGISGEAQTSTPDLGYHQKLTAPNGQDIAIAEGKWSINEDVSKIFFEIGPRDGRVKGEFRNIAGEFKTDGTAEGSQITVKIPVKKVTTFNSIRDDELRNDKEFFDGNNFPEIVYTSKSLTAKKDAYLIEGDFTMLGVTKMITTEMKVVGVGEKDGKAVLVLWGMASIDRTEFGMEPSEKIGNVVDFHFEVQLDKN